jgi:flagellum-specific peptidoglycan hydrolase FlgJ
MLKLVALVALFAGFCWVGTHLHLGQHTLFGHLRAIAQTRESQDMFDGARQSAGPLVDDVRRRIAGVPATAKAPAAPAVEEADDAPANPKAKDPKASDPKAKDPQAKETQGELAKAEDAKPAKVTADKAKPAQETLTASERRHLRRLISSAEGASARQ